MLTRAGFIRVASAGAAGALLTATAARAQLPVASAHGDDVGFAAFLGVAALISADALHRARRVDGVSAAGRAQLTELRAVKRGHLARLNAALGPDEVVLPDDYKVALPAAAF